MTQPYRIWKRYTFAASHQLRGLPEDHQCSRLHGHNYVVEVELAGQRLDKTGFVRDFGEMKVVKAWIDDRWDHRHLNDTMNANPTAENMAAMLYRIVLSLGFPEIVAVRVQETETSWAEYRP